MAMLSRMPVRLQYLEHPTPAYHHDIQGAAYRVALDDPRVSRVLELLDAEEALPGVVHYQLTPERLREILSAYLVVELRARGYRLGWDSIQMAATLEISLRSERAALAMSGQWARWARLAQVMADDLVALELCTPEEGVRPEVPGA